jgi:hypothetical protein
MAVIHIDGTCPACGEPTLIADPDGHVLCSHDRVCPDPWAAARLLHDPWAAPRTAPPTPPPAPTPAQLPLAERS